MLSTKPQQLVLDTIHYQPEASDFCFVVNKPGVQLIRSDASYLPAVRAALLETAQRDFRGLDYVIGAFLVLSTKYAPDTMIAFIQSLPKDFAIRVIGLIPAFFQKTAAGNYNFDVGPSQDLLEYIRSMISSGDAAMKKKAQKVIRLLEAN